MADNRSREVSGAPQSRYTPDSWAFLYDESPYEAVQILKGTNNEPPAASDWRGPLESKSVEMCFRHQAIFVGLFTTVARKYNFVREYSTGSGTLIAWLYARRLGQPFLLIRKVLPSPEIHIVMTKCDGGTKVTAVAEDDRSILEIIVTEDVRCAEFKSAVKRKCIEQALCTHQTNLTMYHDNALMSSSLKLRKDHDPKKRYNRLPKIIAAPQSRTNVSTVAEPILPLSLSAGSQEAMPKVSAWTRMMLKLLNDDDDDDDDDSDDDAPSSKRQKTAVAEWPGLVMWKGSMGGNMACSPGHEYLGCSGVHTFPGN
jgi:hypothetical protein